jgi:hypothetical protein
MYVGADLSGGGNGENSFSNYLSNPFVLIGGGVLILWFMKRKGILKSNPNAFKSVKALEQKRRLEIQAKASENKVPVKLVEDVQKMSKKEVAEMILSNQKMLNNTKMSNDERKQILIMVDYLEKELDNK